ncbi:unnamed protein product [Knipowitschia caucasica]
MAASRDFYDEQPLHSPRPSRVRRIPGHLEDYEVGFSFQRPPQSPESWSTSSSHDDDEDRIQHLASAYQALGRQMRELQTEMSNVRLTQSAQPAKHRYAQEQQYSSMPQLQPLQSWHASERSGHSSPIVPLSPIAPVQHPPPTGQASVSAPVTAPLLPAVPPNYTAGIVQGAETGEYWPPPPPPVDPAQAALLPPLYDTSHRSVVAPHVVAPQGTPYSAPAPSHPYSAPVYYPHSRQQYAYPNAYTPNSTRMPTAPVSQPYLAPPPVSANVPSMVEMAIASSYGIPKPKLSAFSSGKESDFLLLKGLDSVLSPHSHLTEDYKYQVLLDHLKFPAALQIAKRYINSSTPYSSAMLALQQRYGQPRQLVQAELKSILTAPPVKAGDYQGMEDFSAAVSTLVGMLSSMQGPSSSELQCGSHVDTLLTKLPPYLRDSFAEYCFSRGIIQSGSDRTYTLPDLAEWLERKVQTLQVSRRIGTHSYDTSSVERRAVKTQKPKSTAVLFGSNESTQPTVTRLASPSAQQAKKRDRFKPYCPYCCNQEHYINGCDDFTKLSNPARAAWIKDNKKCWRCGRGHSPANCTLKKPCSTCGEQHLPVLHDVAQAESILTVNTTSSMVFVDQASHSGRVMLKVVPVRIYNGSKYMDTHAVLG